MIEYDPGRDAYTILGIGSDSSAAEINRAFRSAARRHHPDKRGDARGTESFMRAKEARDLLLDPARRRIYDVRRRTWLNRKLEEMRANRSRSRRPPPNRRNGHSSSAPESGRQKGPDRSSTRPPPKSGNGHEAETAQSGRQQGARPSHESGDTNENRTTARSTRQDESGRRGWRARYLDFLAAVAAACTAYQAVWGSLGATFGFMVVAAWSARRAAELVARGSEVPSSAVADGADGFALVFFSARLLGYAVVRGDPPWWAVVLSAVIVFSAVGD